MFHQLILTLFSNLEQNLSIIKPPLLNYRKFSKSFSVEKLAKECSKLSNHIENALSSLFSANENPNSFSTDAELGDKLAMQGSSSISILS